MGLDRPVAVNQIYLLTYDNIEQVIYPMAF